jgi:hypothetical protein
MVVPMDCITFQNVVRGLDELAQSSEDKRFAETTRKIYIQDLLSVFFDCPTFRSD